MSEEKMLPVLEEIRDTLKQQLEHQQASIKIQKEQFQMAQTQFARAEKLNDKAEAIQEKSANLVAAGGKIVKIVIPLIFILLAYAVWVVYQ